MGGSKKDKKKKVKKKDSEKREKSPSSDGSDVSDVSSIGEYHEILVPVQRLGSVWKCLLPRALYNQLSYRQALGIVKVVNEKDTTKPLTFVATTNEGRNVLRSPESPPRRGQRYQEDYADVDIEVQRRAEKEAKLRKKTEKEAHTNRLFHEKLINEYIGHPQYSTLMLNPTPEAAKLIREASKRRFEEINERRERTFAQPSSNLVPSSLPSFPGSQPVIGDSTRNQRNTSQTGPQTTEENREPSDKNEATPKINTQKLYSIRNWYQKLKRRAGSSREEDIELLNIQPQPGEDDSERHGDVGPSSRRGSDQRSSPGSGTGATQQGQPTAGGSDYVEMESSTRRGSGQRSSPGSGTGATQQGQPTAGGSGYVEMESSTRRGSDQRSSPGSGTGATQQGQPTAAGSGYVEMASSTRRGSDQRSSPGSSTGATQQGQPTVGGSGYVEMASSTRRGTDQRSSPGSSTGATQQGQPTVGGSDNVERDSSNRRGSGQRSSPGSDTGDIEGAASLLYQASFRSSDYTDMQRGQTIDERKGLNPSQGESSNQAGDQQVETQSSQQVQPSTSDYLGMEPLNIRSTDQRRGPDIEASQEEQVYTEMQLAHQREDEDHSRRQWQYEEVNLIPITANQERFLMLVEARKEAPLIQDSSREPTEAEIKLKQLSRRLFLPTELDEIYRRAERRPTDFGHFIHLPPPEKFKEKKFVNFSKAKPGDPFYHAGKLGDLITHKFPVLIPSEHAEAALAMYDLTPRDVYRPALPPRDEGHIATMVYTEETDQEETETEQEEIETEREDTTKSEDTTEQEETKTERKVSTERENTTEQEETKTEREDTTEQEETKTEREDITKSEDTTKDKKTTKKKRTKKVPSVTTRVETGAYQIHAEHPLSHGSGAHGRFSREIKSNDDVKEVEETIDVYVPLLQQSDEDAGLRFNWSSRRGVGAEADAIEPFPATVDIDVEAEGHSRGRELNLSTLSHPETLRLLREVGIYDPRIRMPSRYVIAAYFGLLLLFINILLYGYTQPRPGKK